jgi:beta-lactamase superfamily II metal-dependent hydrolase/predicted extracellular nuclease
MRIRPAGLLSLVLLTVLTAPLARGAVVISQVYGGGGNSGSVYKNDFIELFNAGGSTVSLSGWSVQYASATGTTWQVTSLSGSLAPGQYYLVQEAVGAGGTTNLPTPDATGAIAMSATAGKVALVSATTALSGACPSASILDFAGFGATANCFEGAGPTPAPSNTTAVLRAASGCTDTNVNSADFSAGAPAPRNTASPTNSCTPAAPATPTGLAAVAGTSHVALTWNSVAGATSYNVKRSTTSGSGYSTISSPGTNSSDDGTAVDGTQYFYVVSAVGPGGESADSSQVTATPMAAPINVVATPGDAHVLLAWDAVAGATSYNVLRSTTSGSGYASVATPAANSYDDTTAVNGTQYFYVIDAVNSTGQSIHSSEVSATPATPGKIVISQVYGGGGNSGSVFKNDFIELFNSGGTSVSVAGWSVQYASATGTTWQVTNLSGSIAPGKYYLVQEAVGAGGTTNLPAPEATGTIPMAATAGKVALVSATVALSGACPSAGILDFVGFGSTANCFEGPGPTPAPSNANAVFRAAAGCTDTNNNSSDFSAAAAAPRNGATPANICGAPVNLPPTITPPGNPITTVTQDAPPFGVSLSGVDDGGIFNWSATPGTGVTTVIVSNGQGTANVTYTVTLQGGYNGTATFTATLTDNVNPPVNQPVNIQVNPLTPPPAPTGLNATAGDSHVALAWNPVGGATSYKVKRATVSGGPYSTINSPVTNSYDDTTAVNGTQYFYVVSAVGPGGEGADSAEVSATPSFVTPVPTGLVAVVSSGSVALSWNAVGSATSYNLKRATASGGPYSTINSPSGTTYTDTAVTSGTRYFYVVSAVAPGSGESVNSTEVHAKPDVPEALGVDLSQVYGAGGNTGAVFTNDFIEVFNRGNSAVDLNGWSVQYASAGGTSWTPTNLSGTLLPGQHFLAQEGAGAGGTTPLPAPDAIGAIAMSGTSGKVALVSSTTALSGACPGGVIDFVGYGSSGQTCFEGAGPTPNPSGNTNSQQRASNGCVDTNNNATDFANGAANPRNTATAATPCAFTAIGSATPGSGPSGGSFLLKVELPPPTVGGSVTGNLSSAGGSATQTFFDDGTNGDVTIGDNIFTFQTTATASAGVVSLPVSATNLAAQTANTTILLTITPPLETIAAVKVDTTPADTVPDRLGQPVLIRGVVTSIDFRGGAGIEYYIQDPTAGIDIFSTTDVGPALSIGTNVEVSGTVTQFNGLTEITPASITTLPGGTLPAVSPQVVTLSQLLDGVGEPLEGKLVRIDELTVTLGTFPASGVSGNVTITDPTGSGTLRIDSDTDIDGTTAPGGIFSLIGLAGQSDTTNPFDCCYQVLPRSTADIIPRTPPTGTGASNPPSVPPGGATLLTMTVTLGQNPPSTGVTAVANLSTIGLSPAQTLFDDGSNGDVSPGDQIYSYQATVDSGTALGPKSLPVVLSDAQSRSSVSSIPLNIQSPFAPPTPLNLVATPGNAQVGLTWDPSLGASGYNVKRSTVTGGPYSTIASAIVPASYTDSTVTNGTTYYYVVSALSGVNESGNSTEASALPTAPPPSGPLAKVYFVDIGQGAGTLIVGPTGTSMLIDAGPPGQGTTKVIPLLNSVLPPADNVDYSILTHYHVDHDGGLTEVINAGRLDGGIAYDNGDGPNVVPPVPTNSTGTAFTAYKNAIASRSGAVTRTTILPGQVIDLGGGMKATCIVAGGNLASGGNVYVSGTDLNSSSISTLMEFNGFDILISGDMTGGGQTTTAKTPDVETFAGQLVGDVDFVQLDHHGSTTANQRRFLSQLKAEGSLASIGATNTFGHPNRETANKYLNTPVTSGNTYGGESLPNPGNGPVYYQTDPSPATDNRTSVQGYSGADQAHAGQGTILLKTDGLISFTMESFDDGGARISPAAHVYALDGQGSGVTTNFPPTVIPNLVPRVPLATDAPVITALVNDREDPITSVTLDYSLNGAVQAPVMMTPTGSEYSASIPAQPNGTRVDYTVTAVGGGKSTSYTGGYFAGTTTISSLRSVTALGEPTYLDYGARISGTATSTTGDYSSTNNDDYIHDGTGALNVSRTIEPSVPATQPMTSASTYTVTGFINQLTGRFRLDVTPPFDGIDKPWASVPGSFNPYSITSTGPGVVTPLSRTIAQINADPEGNEAQLVTIANCTVVSGTIPSSGGLDAFLVVSDGTGTIEMKIDADSDIPGLPTPAGLFTLLGIVQQDDFLRPFNARYTVAPRDRTDLGAPAGGPALITIAQAREDIDATTGTSPDNFIPDRLGQQVKIRGVVTSVDFRGAAGTEVYIQDPTGGVDIFSTTINTVFNIGDNLEVIGTVSQFNGLTEIAPGSASDITILPPGTLPAVGIEVVTASQLGNAGAGEAYEGKLIRVNNVTLASPPATFVANTNYNISDVTGTVQMRIDGDTNIPGTVPPGSPFSVVGVLGQFDSTNPFDSGYQLFPRTTADFFPATPAAASILATSGTPQTTNVNTAFGLQLQATVRDAGSTPIQGAGVTFTAPSTGASGTFANGTTSMNVATNAGGVATSTVFTANGAAGPYDVVASTNALTASFNLTNHNPSATHFDVSAPSNVTTGVAFNVTVTARDSSNATATGYTGTVHFTSSSAGTLPSDYTFVGGDNGAHVFSFTLTSTGPRTITATDTVTASINGTANLTVDPPSATHFGVTAPASVTNSVAFNVTVTALDASEATVTGYTGTVHFTSSSAGTLPGNYTFTGGDNGTHVFSVTLTTNGPRSVTATDTVTASITGTANTTVNAPPQVATHFGVTAPASVTNSVAFNVTVTALDASEATVTGYTGTVHFTSSSAGTLPSNYTFTGGDNGTHVFSVTLTTNGPRSVTATDTVTASINGTANTTVTCPVPTIASQTEKVKISRGATATIGVTTLNVGVTFQWYEGNTGNTSSPVGTNAPTFTTPPLQHTTQYWVRLTTACGTVDSEKIKVQVGGLSVVAH